MPADQRGGRAGVNDCAVGPAQVKNGLTSLTEIDRATKGERQIGTPMHELASGARFGAAEMTHVYKYPQPPAGRPDRITVVPRPRLPQPQRKR